MVVSWWFTMVRSAKDHLKEIQEWGLIVQEWVLIVQEWGLIVQEWGLIASSNQ